MKPLEVRQSLLKQGKKVFTPQEFARIFNSGQAATKYFLETQAESGLLMRLKKGVYMLKTDPASEEEIANVLYQPSYISLEYALAEYGVLPEMTYQITSCTTKPTRLFTLDEKAYSYRTIKKQAFTGYALVKRADRAFLMADLEKALTDYLYLAILNKTAINDRLIEAARHKIQRDKLDGYISLFKNRSLEKKVKVII